MLVDLDGGAGHVLGELLQPVLDRLVGLLLLRLGQGGVEDHGDEGGVAVGGDGGWPDRRGVDDLLHPGDRHEVGIHGRRRGEELLGLRVDALPEGLDARPGRVVLGQQRPAVEGLAGHSRLAELESVEQGLPADPECGHEVRPHRQQDADERHGLRVPGHRRTVAGEDPVGIGSSRVGVVAVRGSSC